MLLILHIQYNCPIQWKKCCIDQTFLLRFSTVYDMVYNWINKNRILGSSNEVTKTTFINYFFAPQAYLNLSEMKAILIAKGMCILFLTHWQWKNGVVNSLRLRQNGRYNAGDIFKCIFLKENVWILTKIPLKFVPKGRINNIPALVQIMAWRRPGDKPLSEPRMESLLMHICVTRPLWVNKKMTVQDMCIAPWYYSGNTWLCVHW